MTDTTTTLNIGSGGDVIDESLVTQSDGVTSAKRQRVAVGGDDGTLQTFINDGVATAGIVKDYDVNDLLEKLLIEFHHQTHLLSILLALLGDDTGFDENS